MSKKYPSWYNPEVDGKSKDYLEWCFREELEPDEEPGFFRPKNSLHSTNNKVK